MHDDNQSTNQINNTQPTQNNWRPLNEPGSFVSHHGGKPPKSGKKWWPPRLPKTKKGWIIFGIVVALLIGAGVASYFIWFKADPKPVAQVKKVDKPKETPKPLTSTLTGMPIADASVNDRPVTAIMIENSPDARPQSGIDQAGVVFEAVAEGGITRFLTLFQDTEPSYIGPVRSVRPYYVQWLAGFDAAVAHVGGSAQALQDIKSLGVKDLDQFHNPSAYHRISSRYAPHNMYTSIGKLREVEASKGYGKPNYAGFSRKIEAKNAAPNATSIDFAISGALYNAHFDYVAETNSYNRSVGGKPHMVVDEAGAQKQIQPKTVVALVMPKGNAGIYSTYNTIGEGQAYIFQDGVVTVGTWRKPETKANFTFTDANGAPLSLNPGQTWLTALGSSGSVVYK